MALINDELVLTDGAPAAGEQLMKSLPGGRALIDRELAAAVNIKKINQPSDLGTPTGGYYEIPTGTYIFTDSMDFGTTGIKMVGNDSSFRLVGGTPQCFLTYTGTDPFLTTGSTTGGDLATNVWLQLEGLFFTTANSTAVYMEDMYSFLIFLGLFIGCQKTMEIQGGDFITFDTFGFNMCDDGMTAVDVSFITLDRPQWSLGTDSGGEGFNISGAGVRLSSDGIECEAKATESIFCIDTGYTGSISMTGGAYTDLGGNFFKPGCKDQTDLSMRLINIANVPNSDTFAYNHLGDNTATTAITTTGVPVKVNGTWNGGIAQKIGIDPSGIWTYEPSESSNVTVNAVLTVDPAGISQTLSLYLYKNGVQVSEVDTRHQVSIFAAGQQMVLFSIVPMEQGDYLELFIANDTSTNDIDIPFGSFKIG